MPKPDPYIAAIDIGSSKIGVLIGQRSDDGGLEIVGKGLAPNRGSRKGNVVNVEATVAAIKQAAEEAEVMAGVELARAYVGIAGSDIRSVNSRGMVSVARRDREITQQDVDRVLEAAQAAAIPSDREILHAIVREFIVDEQEGIAEPLGMQGSRLEAAVHLVTGNQTRTRTVLTCINRAGVEAVEMVFEPLATAEAVMTHDEKELGALLMDVGFGTTEYALFTEGEVLVSAVLPIGSSHFTNDVAMVLRTPFAEAEKLKIQHGCCLEGLLSAQEGISVPPVAGGAARVVPKLELCEIMQPRAEELFSLIRQDLDRNGAVESLRGGVVLTGGGAQLDGLPELGEQIFNCSVRYGLPQGLGGLVDVISSPSWCTASGLLLYGLAAEQDGRRARRSPFSVRRMMGSLRSMFADLV
ncbi:MAG: cell division protein FtsA [Acidobacteriota bacterium]|nr:cell division protein FtsA [Acidobacteriota bacterium]MDH3522010.1 cell division protein FtsA [Acidobacteriota bacterium]